MSKTTIKTYLALFIAISLIGCVKRREGDPNATSGAVSTSSVAAFSKVASSREVLGYLGVALNYNVGSNDNLITEFSNLYATLPQNGDAVYSGSMSRMFSNFALRVCSLSMNAEASTPATNRIVFKYVDLSTAPNAIAGTNKEQQMQAYIKHIAYRFYGTAIPQDEFNELKAFYEAQRSLVTQDQTGARDLAVQICGIIGSSPRALMRM